MSAYGGEGLLEVKSADILGLVGSSRFLRYPVYNGCAIFQASFTVTGEGKKYQCFLKVRIFKACHRSGKISLPSWFPFNYLHKTKELPKTFGHFLSS